MEKENKPEEGKKNLENRAKFNEETELENKTKPIVKETKP